MSTTLVNRKQKTITTYQITDSVIESFKELNKMFKQNDTPVSLGFQRLEKLSKKKRQKLEVSFLLKGLGQKEVKNFLESMTEKEYIEFKKSK
ncbi:MULTISPECIES: hypothetical protein [Weeksellaceae]|uniref:hypothetical protein n=1 Tax=Weeksellaceae TaxID=2762318 RepID=UPI00244CE6E0|nr:hypothetical protein [Empedobacter sp. GD03739]MDH1602355.1 hypothetical protein [Empedobacter sp. GD03739]